MPFELLSLQTALLVLAAMAAGFVDSIAGGGGLITIPAFLAAGLPPTTAIATNKLQAGFGSFMSTWHYRKAGLMKIREMIPGIIMTAIGASLGALCLQWLSDDFLNKVVPWFLLAVFLYVLFTPKIGEDDRHHRLSKPVFFVFFGLLIGFYDGFFGPGTGSFWSIAFVTVLGFNLKKATGHTKVVNFTSNIVSILIFLIGGQIWIGLGLMMAVGQIAGATLGSKLVIKKGTGFVKVFFLIVVGATLLKLFFQ